MKKFILAALLLPLLAFAQLAPIPPGNLLANTTSSSAAPVANTGTSFFDSAYCNTVGYLIVRFTGSWTCSKSIAANPVWWGADPTGTNDSAAAFNSALAASPFVQFPVGNFKFLSAITYTMPAGPSAIMITGAGVDNTVLQWPSGQGLTINYPAFNNSAHVRDLTIATGSANTGNGLTLVEQTTTNPSPLFPLTDISNVIFRGSDGYSVADYWQYGIYANGVSNIQVNNTGFYGASTSNGVGFYSFGTSTLPAIIYNFVNDNFYDLGNGIVYGNYVQGMAIVNTNFVAVGAGVYEAAGLSNTQSELSITNSQFGDCILSCISLNSPIAPLDVSNNLLEINPGTVGFYMDQAGNFTIIGNMFLGLSSNTSNIGLDIASTTTFFNENAGIISGNQFFYLKNGLVLGSGASGIIAYPNKYANINAANISNSGSGNIIGTLGDELSSYHGVTGSRAVNTVYTNNKGKPMYVSAWGSSTAIDTLQGYVAGGPIAASNGATAGATVAIQFIVPAGSTYEITSGGGTFTLGGWAEEY